MSSPVASTSTTTLSVPSPALTNTTRAPPSVVPDERSPLDNFFGYTLASSRTHESRHDLSMADADVPPAYDENVPPTYTRKAPEPITLARYLFKFGFLFPPFWIMGAWILLSPLTAPISNEADDVESGWMPEKTEVEKQRIIDDMRKVEVRWAWRCLWALLVLIVLATAGGVTAWAVLRS